MNKAVLVAVLLALSGPLHAAEIDGVQMPPARQAAGTTLQLNGMGVRLYSMFRVHVYVAGLYLTQPSGDAGAILRSAEPKLIEIRYLRDVDQNDVHRAWQHYFEANCTGSCRLPQAEIARFLALSPAIKAGDSNIYVFTQAGVQVALNGRTLGAAPGEAFARLLLSTFIGADPTTPELKRALLGG